MPSTTAASAPSTAKRNAGSARNPISLATLMSATRNGFRSAIAFTACRSKAPMVQSRSNAIPQQNTRPPGSLKLLSSTGP